MIIFIPYANYAASAWVLSNRDLYHNRINCIKLLRAFYPDRYYTEYKDAPIGRAWKGFQPSILFYLRILEKEWRKRQLPEQLILPETFEDCEGWLFTNECLHEIVQPQWLEWVPLHSSHRARLLWSDYDWYRQFRWDEKPFPTVIWPSPSVVPGDYVVNGSQVALILQVRRHDAIALMDGEKFNISQQDLRRRVWTRAVSVQT